jgi:hypothetical protein
MEYDMARQRRAPYNPWLALLVIAVKQRKSKWVMQCDP